MTGLRAQLDDVVRRMVWLECACEELRGEEVEVLLHRKNCSFGVEMVDRRRLMGAEDETQSATLGELKFAERLRRVDGVQYRRGVVEDWSN